MMSCEAAISALRSITKPNQDYGRIKTRPVFENIEHIPDFATFKVAIEEDRLFDCDYRRKTSDEVKKGGVPINPAENLENPSKI